MTIFLRLWWYAQKRFQIERSLASVRDRRKAGRIPTLRVLQALLVMGLLRMGSLHALEQTKGKAGWKSVVRGELPSATTNGRVMSLLDCESLRWALRQIYSSRKRNKSLRAFKDDWFGLILDGHECTASYRRHCPDCLQRTVHTTEEDRTQYYHRLVAATLLCDSERMLLDCEMQRPGEDEVACAIRLLERILLAYPRAFQVVVADGLYLRSDFFNFVRRHGKHVIAVLKDDRRDLMNDALALFDGAAPETLRHEDREYRCWDINGFTSWEGIDAPVRVVRSLETYPVRRQFDGRREEVRSEWMWGTSIPKADLDTEGILRFGHGRWSIENEGGFNELVNVWHADHVYRHDGNALLAFWLLAMLVFNLFHAFVNRNLNRLRRMAHTEKYWAEQVTAHFYQVIGKARLFAPP